MGQGTVSAYLTWHAGSVSRHILIEFFSRSGNAGMYVSPVDIITYLSDDDISVSPSLPPASYLFLRSSFSPRRDNTFRVFPPVPLPPPLPLSLFEGAGRAYLAHYTCARLLYPGSSLARISKDRSSARYPAYLGIPSPSFPTLFPRPVPSRPSGSEPGRGIIPLVRRLPGPASRPDSSRFWYRACAG